MGSSAEKRRGGSGRQRRQEIKMLDDLYKNAIVLINEHYVNNPSDFPAATASKALFAAPHLLQSRQPMN